MINFDYIDNFKDVPYFIEIKYSTINNAGLGVFAKQNIPKDFFLGNYVGKYMIIDNNNHNNHNYYMCSVQKYNKSMYFIDSSCLEFSNWTRFINCGLNKNMNNLRTINLIHKTDENQNGLLLFYSTRNIKKGEEIFFEYGEKFKKEFNILY